MRQDVAERLEFVKSQIRGAERAFLGGGFVLATHEQLDRFQISFSSHPCVLSAIKDVRSTICDFMKCKINSRLDGVESNIHPVAVWHSYNRMEQAIRMISAGAEHPETANRQKIRMTVAA
jgi:hypothetical protein